MIHLINRQLENFIEKGTPGKKKKKAALFRTAHFFAAGRMIEKCLLIAFVD
jgi:hypothetical protein